VRRKSDGREGLATSRRQPLELRCLIANIFTQNPMRIDSSMASDYLTTIGAAAGLERPVKVVSIRVENPTPTAGTWTITDGTNTLYEINLPAIIGTITDSTTRLWRTFKAGAPPAGAVMWIERR
jgi:hypothetical protein